MATSHGFFQRRANTALGSGLKALTKMKWIAVAAAVVAAAACVLAQDDAAPPRPAAPLAPGPQRESLRQLTALLIITVLVLLVMLVATIVLAIILRRRVRALERKPHLPTEMEDIWWQADTPERQRTKKD
jgi:heme/copper-type cytochrome/quinol oxidase subunit 2